MVIEGSFDTVVDSYSAHKPANSVIVPRASTFNDTRFVVCQCVGAMPRGYPLPRPHLTAATALPSQTKPGSLGAQFSDCPLVV